MSRYSFYPPYVPVAKRRAQAEKLAKKKQQQGEKLEPIQIEGRRIASTFWGKAWCDNLEAYSDYESRLPRGRTYARNGSVIDLKISKGKIQALISGSELYNAHVHIDPISSKQWKTIKEQCAGKIGSLLELLSGKLSKEIMTIMTDLKTGLFPKPKEIHLDCSCPDWADLCKHLAAVLYGVGSRLDAHPELLFLLRSVHHEELIDTTNIGSVIKQTTSLDSISTLGDTDLSDIFGIDVTQEINPSPQTNVFIPESIPIAPLKKQKKIVKKGTAKQQPAKKTAAKQQTRKTQKKNN